RDHPTHVGSAWHLTGCTNPRAIGDGPTRSGDGVCFGAIQLQRWSLHRAVDGGAVRHHGCAQHTPGALAVTLCGMGHIHYPLSLPPAGGRGGGKPQGVRTWAGYPSGAVPSPILGATASAEGRQFNGAPSPAGGRSWRVGTLEPVSYSPVD